MVYRSSVTKIIKPEEDELKKMLEKKISSQITQAEFALEFKPNMNTASKKANSSIGSWLSDDEKEPIRNFLDGCVKDLINKRNNEVQKIIFSLANQEFFKSNLQFKCFMKFQEESFQLIAEDVVKNKDLTLVGSLKSYLQMMSIMGKDQALIRMRSILTSSIDKMGFNTKFKGRLKNSRFASTIQQAQFEKVEDIMEKLAQYI